MTKLLFSLMACTMFLCFSCEKFNKLTDKEAVDKEDYKGDKDKEEIDISGLEICTFDEANYPSSEWEHIVYKDFEYDGDCIKYGAMKYYNAAENTVVLAEYGWEYGWGVKVICTDGECKDDEAIEKCKFEICSEG